MPSTSCRAYAGLLLYYGAGEVATLARYERVVLQPEHYTAAELRDLTAEGTQALAYLSVGEDTGPPAPWQLEQRNPVWGGHYVDLHHEGWRSRLRQQAAEALASGFTGLMLDTLETPHILGGAWSALPAITALLREVVGTGCILANRAHQVRDAVGENVDGFLFESFSTTWEDGYRSLRGRELLDNTTRLRELRTLGKPVYALDYSNRAGLTDFAVSRAANLGLDVQVSNREVTCLPMPVRP